MKVIRIDVAVDVVGLLAPTLTSVKTVIAPPKLCPSKRGTS